jgi:structural maintenance of chromosome 4
MDSSPNKNAKPRLIITEMILDNFKSYAGPQRVGPFHKVCRRRQASFFNQIPGLIFPNHLIFLQSFSSVVGPNGSGKSNVIDAMLFVFGKRAKQLRLNKVSELIHNSTHHRDLEMAKVSVFFQEIIDLVSASRCHNGN